MWPDEAVFESLPPISSQLPDPVHFSLDLMNYFLSTQSIFFFLLVTQSCFLFLLIKNLTDTLFTKYSVLQFFVTLLFKFCPIAKVQFKLYFIWEKYTTSILLQTNNTVFFQIYSLSAKIEFRTKHITRD